MYIHCLGKTLIATISNSSKYLADMISLLDMVHMDKITNIHFIHASRHSGFGQIILLSTVTCMFWGLGLFFMGTVWL